MELFKLNIFNNLCIFLLWNNYTLYDATIQETQNNYLLYILHLVMFFVKMCQIPRDEVLLPPNSSGDRRSPSELVVEGYNERKPSDRKLNRYMF